MNEITTVILAGGFGTRIKHLLPNIPKPMAQVAGKPFIEWIIKYLQAQQLTDITISTGYLGQIIEQYFKDYQGKSKIKCYQENTPLDTAGGFINVVKQHSKTPKAWLITNGDSLIVADLKPFFDYLNDDRVSGVILGLKVNDASRYGTLIYDDKFNLINFAEKKTGEGVINAGVYLLRHNLIKDFPQDIPLSFEKEVFPLFLSNNDKIKIHIVDNPFLDIGTPESLSQAEAFIIKNCETGF